MLVTVTATVSFVTYLFVMNYVGVSTAKSGKAIAIQDLNVTNGSLTVYVQNVGTEAVSFDPASCIYANEALQNCTLNKTTLPKGDIATITVKGFSGQPNGLKVKVATTDGTSTEALLQ